MQDNIRITSPVPQSDIATKIQQGKNTPVLNPIDPTKVLSSNTAQGAQNSKADSYAYMLNHSSIFNRFIAQMAQTPSLAETLKKLSYEAFTQDGKITKMTASNKLVAQLSEKLKLSPQEIVENLTYQDENQTKFGGKLFDALRELMKSHSESKDFENLLGKFLKSFNGFFSADTTLKSILKNLEKIQDYMPKTYSKELNQLVSKLIVGQPEKSLDINLSTLKNEVVPFLSDYIGKTNDFGKIRDTITLLINDIARFNCGSRDELINKFVDLLDFCKFHFDLPDEKINMMKNVFTNEMSNPKVEKNEMIEMISKMLSEGSKDPIASNATVFKEITSSLLLDHSVFMPLTHLFLPLNYQGQFMFSELWIDKDAKKDSRDGLSQVPATKLFITFDIKGLGYFEATILLAEQNADVEINCPDTLDTQEKEINTNIAQIFSKNGFSVGYINCTKGKAPKRLQEVFGNLYERGAGIDVTV